MRFLLILTLFLVASRGFALCGIDLTVPKYNAAQATFSNLMKQASGWQRPWRSPYISIPIQMDSDGYPLVVDRDNYYITIIHDDRWGREDNVFVFRYDGQGNFRLRIKHTILSQAPGEIVYRIEGRGRTMLQMDWTNPNDHARNMRFTSVNETAYFGRRFLDTWKDFQVVRYMDWLETNNSKNQFWSQRKTASSMNGVSFEDIIAFSNLTKTNPWINIPHLATDNYVRQVAGLFKNSLDPALTVYVEYSNEAWNSIFSQTRYMKQQAARLGINFRQFYSRRTVEIMDIWTTVFGKRNLVRIMSSQFVNRSVSEQVLSFENAYRSVDALAVGPYFGGKMGRANQVEATLRLSPYRLVQTLINEELPRIKSLMRMQKAIANKYKVRLLGYEGGQHLVGVGRHPRFGRLVNYRRLTNLFVAANRQPQMKQAYSQFLTDWHSVNDDVLILFNSVKRYGKYGSWGLLEIGSQLTSPKMAGVRSFCN